MSTRLLAAVVLVATSWWARAELPYKLPPKAKYTASSETILSTAHDVTARFVVDNDDAIIPLFAAPMTCGPGLWDILKKSPHFSQPPTAMSAVKIPLANGKAQELPTAKLQTEDEVAAFRKALRDLLQSQWPMEVREPNKKEFMAYWAAHPSDEITGPLIVVVGKNATLFFQFEKGKVAWADEVRRMQPKK